MDGQCLNKCVNKGLFASNINFEPLKHAWGVDSLFFRQGGARGTFTRLSFLRLFLWLQSQHGIVSTVLGGFLLFILDGLPNLNFHF